MISVSHLLIISGFWPTRDNPISGIFVPQQVAALARRNVQITVVVAETIWRRHGGLCSLGELGIDCENVHLVVAPVLRLPEKISSLPGGVRLNAWLYQHALQKTIGQLAAAQSIDACVIHGLRYAAFGLPAWRHHVAGKVAAVLHGLDPFLANSNICKEIAPLVAAMNASVDAYVLVGSPLRVHADQLDLSQEKIRIIGNGTLIPDAFELTERKQSPIDCSRILSVANLVPLKGLDDSLRALAQLASEHPEQCWQYRIVGDGPFREDLQNLAENLAITDRVEFLGRLPYERTMQEMNETDIFVLPSWGEAFGIVYLEAMARGKPAIGCLDNGAADIITHGVDGFLVPPHGVAELTQTLARIMADSTLAECIGKEARRTAESFSWGANAGNYLDLLGLKPPGRP